VSNVEAFHTAIPQTALTTGSNLLRRALQIDGVFEAVLGAILIFGARPLAALFGLNASAILVGAGVMLFFVAALLFRIAAREPADRPAALSIAILNVAWVILSTIVLLTGWLPLSTAGNWAIALVAGVIAVFAALQFYGVWQMHGQERSLG